MPLTQERGGTRMHSGKKASWCDAPNYVLLEKFVLSMVLSVRLNIVAHQIHSFMAALFLNGSGLFQKVNLRRHTAKMVSELFEEHNRSQSDQVSVECAGINRSGIWRLYLITCSC